MNDNHREALRLLGVYTAGRFDPWILMGPSKASCRAHVMSAFNGKKTPQSKSGVNAIKEAFYAIVNAEGTGVFKTDDCSASQDVAFAAWARQQTAR